MSQRHPANPDPQQRQQATFQAGQAQCSSAQLQGGAAQHGDPAPATPRGRIRLFEASDAPALTTLLHAGYAELGEAGMNFTAVDQSVETTLHRASGGQCWVIEDASDPGRLIATLTMSMPPSQPLQRMTEQARVPHCAWLNQMAVHPDCRGEGLAARLWDLARTWALSEAGADSIGVDTAQPAAHLIALYEGWGFESRDIIHWPGKTYDSVVLVRG